MTETSFLVGDGLLGRVIDASGSPLDGRAPWTVFTRRYW